jgi:hypothetical protein
MDNDRQRAGKSLLAFSVCCWLLFAPERKIILDLTVHFIDVADNF